MACQDKAVTSVKKSKSIEIDVNQNQIDVNQNQIDANQSKLM